MGMQLCCLPLPVIYPLSRRNCVLLGGILTQHYGNKSNHTQYSWIQSSVYNIESSESRRRFELLNPLVKAAAAGFDGLGEAQEGEAKEEAKGSFKLADQGVQRVEGLLLAGGHGRGCI